MVFKVNTEIKQSQSRKKNIQNVLMVLRNYYKTDQNPPTTLNRLIIGNRNEAQHENHPMALVELIHMHHKEGLVEDCAYIL